MSMQQPDFIKNPTQFKKDHFEFEYCEECGGDWYDHDLIIMKLGYYGLAPFLRCRKGNIPHYKVRQREKT